MSRKLVSRCGWMRPGTLQPTFNVSEVHPLFKKRMVTDEMLKEGGWPGEGMVLCGGSVLVVLCEYGTVEDIGSRSETMHDVGK